MFHLQRKSCRGFSTWLLDNSSPPKPVVLYFCALYFKTSQMRRLLWAVPRSGRRKGTGVGVSEVCGLTLPVPVLLSEEHQGPPVKLAAAWGDSPCIQLMPLKDAVWFSSAARSEFCRATVFQQKMQHLGSESTTRTQDPGISSFCWPRKVAVT